MVLPLGLIQITASHLETPRQTRVSVGLFMNSQYVDPVRGSNQEEFPRRLRCTKVTCPFCARFSVFLDYMRIIWIQRRSFQQSILLLKMQPRNFSAPLPKFTEAMAESYPRHGANDVPSMPTLTTRAFDSSKTLPPLEPRHRPWCSAFTRILSAQGSEPAKPV